MRKIPTKSAEATASDHNIQSEKEEQEEEENDDEDKRRIFSL